MAELKYKIEAELENIDKVFKVIPSHDKLPTLPILEIAGVATLLHNFYNGIENIIKQILSSKRITVPEGNSVHGIKICWIWQLKIISFLITLKTI